MNLKVCPSFEVQVYPYADPAKLILTFSIKTHSTYYLETLYYPVLVVQSDEHCISFESCH